MQRDANQSDRSGSDLFLDELADEFVTRTQAGESPLVADYCRRYPELQEQIRELFTMLSMLEGAKAEIVPHPDERTPPPERIGDYLLVREIGRGGMGIIYEARHMVVGRSVALKILPQRLATDRRALARFEREARAIAGLHHTNVVPLFEFGQDDGCYFLVMQLIDGESVDKLTSRLRQDPTSDSLQSLVERRRQGRGGAADEEGGTLDASKDHSAAAPVSTRTMESRFLEAAALGYQIASALDHAHRRGIIHRDVKPSNILLDRSGIAWLTDFGLAKTDGEELTQTGDFLGTLRYTAPERFRGQCDGRSDLYALGLTLYEMLALQPAFPGADRIELFHAIENGTPPALRRIDPRIPRDLETIISKAIAHDPAARYATAGEMADDLQRFLADEPIHARTLSVREKLERWRRRNRPLAGALSLLVCVVLLTMVGTAGFLIREARLRQQAEEAVGTANHSREKLRQTLYFAEMNLAGQAADASGGTHRVLDLIQHWAPRDPGPDMRGWEWFYLNARCHREFETLMPANTRSGSLDVCWNPAGTCVAIAHANGQVSLWNVADRQQRMAFLGHASAVSSVAWSPDGQRLASGDRNGWLKVWSADDGAELCSVHRGRDEVQAVRWSPDARVVAWGQGPSLYVWEAAGEADAVEVGRETEFHSINVIQWSPDGTQLFAGNWWQNGGAIWDVVEQARVESVPGRFVKWQPTGHALQNWLSANNTGRIQVWDASTQQLGHTLLGHTAAIRSLAWSPDGARLISAGDDRSLRVWELATGNPLDILQGHADQVLQAAWDPQGRRVASVDQDGMTLIWKVPGGSITTLTGPVTRVQKVTWQRHGNLLASFSRDGDVQIWNVPERKLVTILTSYPKQAESLQWSPDGQQLVTGSRDGTLWIWDANTGACLRELTGHIGPVVAVDWHPDGQTLASTGEDGTLRLWNLADSPCHSEVRTAPTTSQCVRWNPQGTMLATGDKLGTICIWDRNERQPTARWKGHLEAVVDLAWGPDGRQLASGSVDDTVKIWNVDDRSLNQLLLGHSGPVWGVDWNADGDRLVTSSRDGTVRVWDPVSGSEVLTLRGIGPTGEFWSVRWSPDGRQIAAGSANGTITLWDASLGYPATNSVSAE